MKTKLEAPGEITHLGWQGHIQIHRPPSYFVEWRYECPHGFTFALQCKAEKEEYAITGTERVEEDLIKLVNYEWLTGHMMRECGCNPNPLDYYQFNHITGDLEHITEATANQQIPQS